ncbi:hypothetical protein ACSTDW_22625, partial [Vibrio vulnificus]
ALCIKGQYVEEKIKDWLKKTGYPLELYVQKELMKAGYSCDKSPLYVDLDTSVSRELDVVAHKLVGGDDIPCSFETKLYIECKKSEKPLIVLTASSDKTERFMTLFGHEVIGQDSPPLNLMVVASILDLEKDKRAELLGEFAQASLVGYSLVTSFSKSDENIYKGIMGLCKANEFYRSKYLQFLDVLKQDRKTNPDTMLHYELQSPVLIVDCPLFNAYLDDSGELEVEESYWASLRVKLPWVIGERDEERECSIQVVRKEYFPEFLAQIEKVATFASQKDLLDRMVKFNT